MNRFSKSLFFSFLGILILLVGVAAGAILVKQNQNLDEKAAPSSSVSISPVLQEVGQGNSFSYFVISSTTDNLITGIDLRLKYDKDIIEVTSIERGASLGDFNNIVNSTYDNNNGTITYIAFTLDKSKAISGQNLNLLRINAKVKPNSPKATYTLLFDETKTVASAVEETENVLITFNPGSITVIDHQDEPPTYGEPNSCGGTCGSNGNCRANLYCYNGFCRNPICANETDCTCSAPTTTATAKATIKSIAKTKSTATPTSQPKGGLENQINSSPLPGFIYSTDEPDYNLPTDASSVSKSPQNEFLEDLLNFLPYILAVGAGVVIILVILKKRKDKIPHIVPPQNI